MRIAQRTMYQNFVTQMNDNLSAYMDTNIEAATQKRINKPSDDPVGMARVLNYRASLAEDDQFKANLDTAKGWLGTTDEMLLQVSNILTKIKTLTQEVATETTTAENRLQASYEVRELHKQLINIANTQFAGHSIFAGQMYNGPAYGEALGVTSDDPNLTNTNFQVSGQLSRTALIRFPEDGEIPPVGGTLTYEYSKDGGKTWQTELMAEGTTEIDLDGVRVTVSTPPSAQVTAYDPKAIDGKTGSLLYVRPTAQYLGYDNSSPPKTSFYGEVDPSFKANPVGTFEKNVSIRFDQEVDLSVAGEFDYSYSTDGGRTWTAAKGMSDGIATTGIPGTRLLVPGGYVDITIDDVNNATIPKDSNLIVRPQMTQLDYESELDSLFQVNNVGKDIFGGIYKPLNSNSFMPAQGGSSTNMFETIGKLLGYMECNNTDGIGNALKELGDSTAHVLNYATKIGGKENRLEVAEESLMVSRENKVERMSVIEDADLTSLLTRLAQEQLAYSTVLKSSSMIMGLNLTKFL